MKDRFGAKNPRSWMLRFHTQTAGVSLTAQQPLNNIVRVAIQALAGVLGGTQSLHTDSYDEALALPSDEAALIALRTQQIIAHESGAANVVDPLGGSYFIEKLTRDLEEGALEYFRKIDDFGGMIEAIDAGFPQREIQDSAYQYQLAVDAKDKIIVGVNEFVMENEPQAIPLLQIDESTAGLQSERLARLRAQRDNRRVAETLKALADGARAGQNTMYLLLDAVRAYATLGEMCDALRPVYGEYQEPAF
jgi:methylmalonyl-CoA mutase N-terminal domain/subunit